MNELPHPQPPVAAGFLKANPAPIIVAHVVNLYALQVLGAKRVHKDPDPMGEIENLILTLGGVLNAQAVLESRAPPRKDRHPKPRILSCAVIVQE